MFANTKKLLTLAHKKKYAVPHFNINNMEIVQGVVSAAKKLKSPIILATSEGAIKYAGMEYLLSIAKVASKEAGIPIALHLDHGRDINVIKKAIKLGYSSVMFDGSNLSFKDNIKITSKIVKMAHRKGISVEAELGTIGGAEDLVSSRKIIYTDPAKAEEFVAKTKCDFLAVAIGTSHGKGLLRQDILKEINERIKIPLVLHGASGVPRALVTKAEKYGASLKGVVGVPNAQIRKAIQYGITKINTDTDLRISFDAAVRKFLQQHPKDFDPRHILGPARDLIEKTAQDRIMVFGSKNKA